MLIEKRNAAISKRSRTTHKKERQPFQQAVGADKDKLIAAQKEELELAQSTGETRKLFKLSNELAGYWSKPSKIFPIRDNTTNLETKQKFDEGARPFRTLLNRQPPTDQNWDSEEKNKC